MMKTLWKILLGAIVLGTCVAAADAVHDEKPANAAFYCAPWQDYWCYQKWLRCGPYQYNPYIGIMMDRCGNILL